MAHSFRLDSIDVACDKNAPDAVEDGYIGWAGDPAQTKFLPRRENQFQPKRAKVLPCSAAREVLAVRGRRLQTQVI